jgi:hypothetical protein
MMTLELPRWLNDIKQELKNIDFSEFRSNDIRGAMRLGDNEKPLTKRDKQ